MQTILEFCGGFLSFTVDSGLSLCLMIFIYLFLRGNMGVGVCLAAFR